MCKKKAQALIFVLFVLAVLGVLSAAAAIMWQAELRQRALEREGLIAFYLAQAAVEQAKIAALYGYWAPGTYSIPDQNSLDAPGDNYQLFYDISIINPGGAVRTVTGTGRVLDLAGNEIARRQIQAVVTGISDAAPPIGEDDDLTGALQPWSWRQI